MGCLRKSILLASLVVVAGPAAARTYCCTDSHGQLICGDILPPQCMTRSYRELNSQGVIAKEFPGPLTPEQRAELKAEQERRKAAEREASEQAKRDHALLASYTSVADIDEKRKRTLLTERANLRNAEERLANAQERQQRFAKAAERYKDKPMPEVLQNNIRISETELQAAQRSVAEHKEQLQTAEKQFEDDRRRFMELTAKRRAGEDPLAGPPPVAR